MLTGGVQIRNYVDRCRTPLTLSEALESFKTAGEDFAVIMNEYALVVGIITLNDVMTTLMGDLVGQGLEEQIVARDENSWLIDGAVRRLMTGDARAGYRRVPAVRELRDHRRLYDVYAA